VTSPEGLKTMTYQSHPVQETTGQFPFHGDILGYDECCQQGPTMQWFKMRYTQNCNLNEAKEDTSLEKAIEYLDFIGAWAA